MKVLKFTKDDKNKYKGDRGDLGPQGIPGDDGRKVELQQAAGYVQWRHEGDSNWRNLIPLELLKGAVGAPGAEVELKATKTAIQWRRSGETWRDLIALSELQGPQGEPGVDGSRWYAARGNPRAGLGVLHDFYLDSTNGDFYEKTTSGWRVKGSLKGADGSSPMFSGGGVSGGPFVRGTVRLTVSATPPSNPDVNDLWVQV